MYTNGLKKVKTEDTFKYNLLFCHACLTPNRTLTMVGPYVDIYLKICDNVRMNVTSQAALCWECMSMLRKILAFRLKVQKAEQIRNYCVKNQAPPLGLTSLTQDKTETTTYPSDDELDEDQSDTAEDQLHEEQSHTVEDQLDEDQSHTVEDDNEERMMQIYDVKGHYDLTLDSSSCDTTLEVEEERIPPPLLEERREEESRMEEERRMQEEKNYPCWKRTVLLVLKRICGHRYAHPFLKPVSDECAPQYSEIIHRPTDLCTIRKQIQNGTIRTTEQLKHDLLLMFTNAFMYNSSHHEIYKMALELRAETLRELSLLAATQSDSPQSPPQRPRRSSCIRDFSLSTAQSPPSPPLRRRCRTPCPPRPAPRPVPRRRRALTCAARDEVTVSRTNEDSNPVRDSPAATVRRRRRSEWSQPTPTPTPTTATADAATVRRRRRSERSQPTPTPTTATAGAATVRRRRRSEWSQPTPTPTPTTATAAAATVRRRRRSEWLQPTPTPAPSPTPTTSTIAGSRRRSAWTWTALELDTEFLEPRHYGKICKAAL